MFLGSEGTTPGKGKPSAGSRAQARTEAQAAGLRVQSQPKGHSKIMSQK